MSNRYELSGYVSRMPDKLLIGDFGQGAATFRKRGHLSDNPHEWGTLRWHVWREGFWYEERQA